MTISVVIPACDAEPTLSRALDSLFAQTDADWEAIIVSDDGRDYSQFLAGKGITDPRLRFGATGQIRSGAHNARNAGFQFISGSYVTHLDADDELTADRFATLRPLAARHGAAADNLLLIHDSTDKPIQRVMGSMPEDKALTLADFMRLDHPLVPLIRRDHLIPRVKGVEFSEDVIANIQLIDQIGALPVTAASSYIYRIRSGSMANSMGSSAAFEENYTAFIERLETGDGFGLKHENRLIAREGFEKKRALNRAFMAAQAEEPDLTFAEFARR
jgi:succinoglycan biosynthesis protein ExoO